MAVKSLGTLTVDLIAKTGGFTGPLEKAQRQMKTAGANMGKSARAAAVGVAGLGTAFVGATGAAIAFTSVLANNAIEMQKQAQVANASVAELQAWGTVTDTMGVSTEKLSDILKDLNDRLGEFSTTGGGEMADFFALAEQVGVTIDSFSGLSGPESLQLVLDTLDDLNLSGQQTTFILESIADDASALAPLMGEAAGQAASLALELENMGVAQNAFQTEALRDYADSLNRIQVQVADIGTTFASELAPYLTDTLDWVGDMIGSMEDLDETFRDWIEFAIRGTADLTDDVGYLWSAFEAGLLSVQSVGLSVMAELQNALTRFINASIQELNNMIAAANLLPTVDLDFITPSEGNWVDYEGRIAAVTSALEDAETARDNYAAGQTRINAEIAIGAANVARSAANFREQAEATDEATEAVKINTDATKGAAKANQEQAKAQREADKAAQQLVDSYTSLLDTLFPLEASQKQYTEDLALLDAAAEAGAISTDKLTEAQKRLREQSAEGLGGFEDAPTFGGLDASVGGALGEQFKIKDAQAALEEWHTAQLDQLAEFREARADLNEEWNARELDIEAQYQEQRRQLQQATDLALLSSTEDLFAQSADAAKAFGGEQSKLYQAMFVASKAFAIAQSLVAIQTGIANAAAIPWPANLAAMASVAAATASIISNIQSVQMVGQAHDGIMSVPESGTWNLQKGERVLTQDTAENLDQTLSRVDRDTNRPGNQAAPEVNLYEDASKAGQASTTQLDEKAVIDIWVANISRDGRAHQAMVGKYPLKTRGR